MGTTHKHTHTHTHPFYNPLDSVRDYPGEPVPEPIWNLLEQESEWQRQQLGHMQICTLPQTDNHESTPPFSIFLQAGCPSCHPTNSVKALKANMGTKTLYFNKMTIGINCYKMLTKLEIRSTERGICPIAKSTTHTQHTTILRLFGFCPGQPGWASTRRNIHPLTLIVVLKSTITLQLVVSKNPTLSDK